MEPGGPGNLATRLQDFGIPVVYSDVSTNGERAGPHRPPQDELPDLMRMWGAILGREEEAESFVAFHRHCIERVARRLAGAPPRKTYLEVMSVSDECCWAAGQRIWGELLSLAGGRSLDGVSAPWFSRVQIEHLINDKPDVYIATGGAFSSRSRPALGPGFDPRPARENLKRLTERAGFSFLPAVRDGRVHAVWTGLITVQPFNLLFAEIVAKWLHPELTSDIDPDATLSDMNARFATKLDGALWISLS
jgi:iron complex transport system substrate-binding protein